MARKKKSASTENAHGARLLLGNVDKKHVVALPLENGLVAIVPVSTHAEDYVAANFTEVAE